MDIPPNRKCHIVRIFGTNAAGDLLTDIWADVLRIDEIVVKTQDTVHQRQFANQFQKFTIKLKWRDENGFQEEFGETRKTVTVKVCDPDGDLDNPEEWVPIECIKKVRLKDGNVDNNRNFLTAMSNKESAREVESRRVLHQDTNIDDEAEESGNKVYRVSTDNYFKEEEKDEDTYVEHEITKRFQGRSTHHWLESNGDDLDYKFNLKNEFLLDETEPAKFDEVGSSGYDPPYRLDPFQNIINVQLKPVGAVFAMGTHDGFIWSSVMKNKTAKPTFEKVGAIGSMDAPMEGPGQFFGGSYALVNGKTPTFLLAGDHLRWVQLHPAVPDLSPYDVGKIMLSHDGITWTTVFVQDNGFEGAVRTMNRMVWDEDAKAFFVEMFWREQFIHLKDPDRASECWTSKDGHSWSMIDRKVFPATYTGSLLNAVFETHLRLKDTSIRQETGAPGGIPDGCFGIDTFKKNPRKTYPMGKVVDKHGTPGGKPPIGLLIKDTDFHPSYYQQSVAFAGDIWGWSGPPNDDQDFYISTDGAATWQAVGKLPPSLNPFHGNDAVNVIVAGNYKDVIKP